MKDKKQIEITSYFAAFQMISHSSKFGRIIAGFYRSEYERRFANCLKNMGIAFDFERYAFKIINNGVALHMIPDFYIHGTNLFIEISRYCSRKRKHQILLFQEQYPNLKLMLLNFKDVNRYAQCKLDIDFDSFKLKAHSIPIDRNI